ncbi:amidase domain-containing protein [Metabacillus sp. KIGAM252]|uniref:Amidase domain-containing protein n=1 Tax=Metabacillus flavus TaxID=2823519 RepID=A0ABS5LBA5_9BACI|nr:amidase domain-containing protein [Metabacillus flavus]MBS2968007.1 amidase domain-containing protein [Metabacillus flavus]
MVNELLRTAAESRLDYVVNGKTRHLPFMSDAEKLSLERKAEELNERKTLAIKGSSKIKVTDIKERGDFREVQYILHEKWLIQNDDSFYLEEKIVRRLASLTDTEVLEDLAESRPEVHQDFEAFDDEDLERKGFYYDRMAAVQYAERWWNSHNSQYKNFDVNCTNFVSQCLRSGGAQMRGYPGKGTGWWMQNNTWSYSWAVAHSMNLFLPRSKTGLRGIKVGSAEELRPGDVVCYDFEGDGRFDHTTFVVAKDKNNMPLVNAQTSNSRMRYWSYKDSTAYTPNIRYSFYRIQDDSEKS